MPECTAERKAIQMGGCALCVGFSVLKAHGLRVTNPRVFDYFDAHTIISETTACSSHIATETTLNWFQMGST